MGEIVKSVLSHESDAGRGHTEPSAEDVPHPCMPQCRHSLVSLSSVGGPQLGVAGCPSRRWLWQQRALQQLVTTLK